MADVNSQQQAEDVPSALGERIADALQERGEKGLLRSLSARGDFAFVGENTSVPTATLSDWRDLSGNDYLRLSRHPQVVAAAVCGLERWGVSSSASPLISGYTEAHRELEERLCRWAAMPHGLVWNTGYAANQAVLGTLPQRGDLVFADRLIHNSMITGLVRSGARLQRYRHCDLDHLQALLEGCEGGAARNVFVVTESVYSMDGDFPDLKRMAELKSRYGFFWVVDEAHALGWYGTRGSGLVEHFDVAAEVDVLVGTLGKGLGSMGAYTLFRNPALREYLINFSGEFIYSTYLAPACACAASCAIEIVEEMGAEGRQRLHTLARSVRHALGVAGAEADADSPIVPLPVGSTHRVVEAAAHLRSRGFSVGAVRPPTVPEGGSRLRLSLHAELTTEHITQLAAAVKEALQ